MALADARASRVRSTGVDVANKAQTQHTLSQEKRIAVQDYQLEVSVISTGACAADVSQGEQQVVHFDGQNDENEMLPEHKALPDGKYFAQIDLYPLWGLIDNAAKSAGLTQDLSSKTKPIKLTCGGESAASVKQQLADKVWAMDTVHAGMPWQPSFWTSRVGKWQELPYTGPLAPGVVKMIYFPRVDITFEIDVRANEINGFRFWRATE